jgi:DNA/RNA non-specific endonuclease
MVRAWSVVVCAAGVVVTGAAPAGAVPAGAVPAGAVAAPVVPPTVPCNRLLTPNTTYTDGNRHWQTDGNGRPRRAVVGALVRQTAARNACTRFVGQLGPAGFQGGHLIAADFNGPSERYNLVPLQGTRVNQGVMAHVETWARTCLQRGGVHNYVVTVKYPAPTSVVPARIRIAMTPQALLQPRRVTVTIPNRALAAQPYQQLIASTNTQFRAAGC